MEQGRKIMFDAMIARDRQQMSEFFKLDPKGRLDYLNKEIDKELAWRQERQARATTQPSTIPALVASAGSTTGGPGGAGSGAPGGGPPGGGGWRNGRNDPARMKQMEDNYPADLRAAKTEYRRQMTDARIARGLPPNGGRGGR